jgi:histidine ammonia-lyase
MGFRVELKMHVSDPYTDQTKPTIEGAFRQFVEQYNSAVTACEIQILPDNETINIVEETPPVDEIIPEEPK